MMGTGSVSSYRWQTDRKPTLQEQKIRAEQHLLDLCVAAQQLDKDMRATQRKLKEINDELATKRWSVRV